MRLILGMALLAVVPGAEATSRPTSSPDIDPAHRFLSRVRHQLDTARAAVPDMVGSAETVADALIAGGHIYVAASHLGLRYEGTVRAGGLMMLRRYMGKGRLSPADTVLVLPDGVPDKTLCAWVSRIRASGARTLLIGSRSLFGGSAGSCPWRAGDFTWRLLHATPIPDGVVPVGPNGSGVGRLSALATALYQWAWTAELIGALTRKGKTPVLYQSVGVSGGRQRNLRYRGQTFHTDLRVLPMKRCELGRKYLDAVRALLVWFETRHGPAIRQAGAEAADAIRKGHRAYAILIGHLPPFDAGRQGDPGQFRLLPSGSGPAQWKAAIHRGDRVLFCGYQHYPVDLARYCSGVGAGLTCVSLGQREYDASPFTDVRFIDAGWPFSDALVTLPGYDVHALPPSGIIVCTAYWTVIVETAASLTATVGP